MDFKHYKPRYTSQGHSIESLKSHAETLQKKDGCKKREALDAVAHLHQYSDWNEIMNQKPSPHRDMFFDDFYKGTQLAGLRGEQYQEFLKEMNLAATPDSFRKYAVKHYESYKKLGFEELYYVHICHDRQILMQDLADQISRKGAFGFLPQNLPSYILESMLHAYEKHSEREEGEELHPDEAGGEPVLFAVLGIKAYQIKKPNIEIPVEELYELCEMYYLRLKLEWLSRRTEMQFQKPTIKNILELKGNVRMEINPKVWQC